MSAATFPTYDTVDLFAGPGGWSLAARRLGLHEMGLELDKGAHLTRRAAGFHTIRDDVRNWGSANFPNARGLIASPPCQTFSSAGKGAGRKALDVVLAAVRGMGMAHREEGHQAFAAHQWEDERTGLVLEPLRWALEAIRLGKPYRWLAFEQVPTVLPVWEAMADVLRAEGYHVATGNLQAEQYGVPQTCKRAVLVASRNDSVRLPVPTHSRFHTRDKARLDLGVLPWVSMAQALGWGMTARPSVTVASGGEDRRGAKPLGAGSGAAATMRAESDQGRWLPEAMVRNSGPGAARNPRPVTDPAYTIRAHGSGSHPSGTEWTHERPATTVVASFGADTISAPGYRVSAADGSRQNAAGSVRVSVEEAGVLQSFPADFPWQGAKTKRYQQVGNAIPPLLAEAVLRAVL